MPSVDEIKSRIMQRLPGAEVEVEDWTGGGDHIRATVIANEFAGLSPVQQHQLVYSIFGDEIGGAIHALSLTTKAPEPAQSTSPTLGARDNE